MLPCSSSHTTDAKTFSRRVHLRVPARSPRLRPLSPPFQASRYRAKSWLAKLRVGGDAPPVDRMTAPDNKQGFLSNLSPWPSRAGTPKPPAPEGSADKAKKMEQERDKDRAAAILAAQQGGDHVIDRRHRLSLKRYPPDCPPLAVRWFHAIDVSSQYTLYSRQASCSLQCQSCLLIATLTLADTQAQTTFEACHGPRYRLAQT